MKLKIESAPGIIQRLADDRYVLETGDTMTGNLLFNGASPILKDANNNYWEITVDTDGALVTTAYTIPGTTGSPMGMLLTLTYS
jgi:hypothetical protein